MSRRLLNENILTNKSKKSLKMFSGEVIDGNTAFRIGNSVQLCDAERCRRILALAP